MTATLDSGYMPVLWVDSDEAGTLLVGLGPHSFDQFELLPVDEGAILLPPLSDALRSARIQAGDMPATTQNNKVKLVSPATFVLISCKSVRRSAPRSLLCDCVYL